MLAHRSFVLFSLVSLLSTRVYATGEWEGIIQQTYTQIVRLEIMRENGHGSVCTGVVLNRAAGIAITCEHCTKDGVGITANGRHATTVLANRILDLALVKTKFKKEQQIILADKSLVDGAAVAVVGYALADPQPMAQYGRIAQALNLARNSTLVDAGLLGGDSGGALIDAHGRLVGINSGAAINIGQLTKAVPIEQIRDFAEQYLPTAAKP